MHIKKSINDEFPYLLYKLSQMIGEPTVALSEKPLCDILQSLENLNLPDQFYFLTDLKKGEITWSFGVQKCLGYEDEIKSEAFFPSLVHPFIQNWYSAWAFPFYKEYEDYINLYQDTLFKDSITLPIRKSNGDYITVKQNSISFQFDEKGRLVSHLNIFSVFNTYKGEPMQPKIFHDTGKPIDIEKRHKEAIVNYIDLTPKQEFTKDEFKMLNRCYEIRNEQSRNNIIKEEFSLSEQTCGRILGIIKTKISSILHLDQSYSSNDMKYLPVFRDVYDAVVFIKESWILDILAYRYQKDPSLFSTKRTLSGPLTKNE